MDILTGLHQSIQRTILEPETLPVLEQAIEEISAIALGRELPPMQEVPEAADAAGAGSAGGAAHPDDLELDAAASPKSGAVCSSYASSACGAEGDDKAKAEGAAPPEEELSNLPRFRLAHPTTFGRLLRHKLSDYYGLKSRPVVKGTTEIYVEIPEDFNVPRAAERDVALRSLIRAATPYRTAAAAAAAADLADDAMAAADPTKAAARKARATSDTGRKKSHPSQVLPFLKLASLTGGLDPAAGGVWGSPTLHGAMEHRSSARSAPGSFSKNQAMIAQSLAAFNSAAQAPAPAALGGYNSEMELALALYHQAQAQAQAQARAPPPAMLGYGDYAASHLLSSPLLAGLSGYQAAMASVSHAQSGYPMYQNPGQYYHQAQPDHQAQAQAQAQAAHQAALLGYGQGAYGHAAMVAGMNMSPHMARAPNPNPMWDPWGSSPASNPRDDALALELARLSGLGVGHY